MATTDVKETRPNNEDDILQSPPVPGLNDTLRKYLDYVQVLCDKNAYEEVRRKAENFAMREGPELQNELVQLALKEKNWINPFWIKAMYLGNRAPLPVYSNPGFAVPDVTHQTFQDYFTYAASFIQGVFDYKSLIDRRAIAPETSTGRIKPQKLCMSQFWNIFSSYRHPYFCMDIMEIREIPVPSMEEHVTVMYKSMGFPVSDCASFVIAKTTKADLLYLHLTHHQLI